MTSVSSEKSFIDCLYPHQKEHLKRLLGVFSEFPYAFDLTPMGGGKTYVGCSIVQAWKYKHVVVVCPVSVSGVWKDAFASEHFKVDNSLISTPKIMSYEELRGHKPSIAIKKATSPKSPLRSLFESEEEEVKEILLPHGLLHAKETAGKTVGKVGIEYRASERLVEICKEGVIFIIDESYRVKNASAAVHEAVATITHTIAGVSSLSRILFLTGTLIDKQEQALNIVSLIGATRGPEMCSYDRVMRSIRLTGALDLIQFCKTKIDKLPKEAHPPDYGQRFITDRKEAATFCYNLLIKRILPRISSAMEIQKENIIGKDDIVGEPTSPVAKTKRKLVVVDTPDDADTIEKEEDVDNEDDIDAKKKWLDCQNLFAKISKEEEIELLKTVEELERLLVKPPPNGTKKATSPTSSPRKPRVIKRVAPSTVSQTKEKLDWKEIKRILMYAEKQKTNTFVRLAFDTLTKVPNSKVVIAVNHIETVEEVIKGLRKLLPPEMEIGMVDGSVRGTKRDKIFKLFQQPDESLRVIVANMTVIALGISLDDQDGRFPRFAFASPSYFAINMHQFVRRFYRANTKGVATVRFVYGKLPMAAASTSSPDSSLSLVAMSPQRHQHHFSPRRRQRSPSPRRVPEKSTPLPMNDFFRESKVLESITKKANVLREYLPKDVSKCILFADDYGFIVEDD